MFGEEDYMGDCGGLKTLVLWPRPQCSLCTGYQEAFASRGFVSHF